MLGIFLPRKDFHFWSTRKGNCVPVPDIFSKTNSSRRAYINGSDFTKGYRCSEDYCIPPREKAERVLRTREVREPFRVVCYSLVLFFLPVKTDSNYFVFRLVNFTSAITTRIERGWRGGTCNPPQSLQSVRTVFVHYHD
jgi:hypothetical protein